jgi:hypothetical protein
MTEIELLKEQVKALKDLVEIQKQTIEALKAKPAQIQYMYQYLPYYNQYPHWQWQPSFINCGATGGVGGNAVVVPPSEISGNIQGNIQGSGPATVAAGGTGSISGCVSAWNVTTNNSIYSHPNNQNCTLTSSHVPDNTSGRDALGNMANSTTQSSCYLSLAK